jgi:hypothetical protein
MTVPQKTRDLAHNEDRGYECVDSVWFRASAGYSACFLTIVAVVGHARNVLAGCRAVWQITEYAGLRVD